MVERILLIIFFWEDVVIFISFYLCFGFRGFLYIFLRLFIKMIVKWFDFFMYN